MDKSSLKMAFGWLKQRRGRMKGISDGGENICFGKYALQALEPAWITAKQIEAGRRALTRNVNRGGGKVWVRTFAHKSVSAKPAETRMGRGKGGVKYSVAVIQPGKILYEMGGVAENIARKAVSVAASKMPIRTRFIVDSCKLLVSIVLISWCFCIFCIFMIFFLVILKSSDTLKRPWLEALRNGGRYAIRSPREKILNL
jgi:large subunit ribosomal protein L16